jgi:hypothetical protein
MELSVPSMYAFVYKKEQMADTNPPAPYSEGSEDTLENFIMHALRYSDNVATNVLMDNIDRDSATCYFHSIGLSGDRAEAETLRFDDDR